MPEYLTFLLKFRLFFSSLPEKTKKTNGKQTVMNNYQAAAAAAAVQGYGPPASPHTTTTRTGFPPANSPGPTIDMYSSSGADSVGYVQATSPQPSGFPAIAVSRAPLNYSPVSAIESYTISLFA